jgi:hypothetical protein
MVQEFRECRFYSLRHLGHEEAQAAYVDIVHLVPGKPAAGRHRRL